MYYYNCTNLFLLFYEKNVVTIKYKITYVTANSGSGSISKRKHWVRISVFPAQDGAMQFFQNRRHSPPFFCHVSHKLFTVVL